MAEANPPLNEKYLDRIAALRLIDDEFFSEALDGKIAAVQVLVDTILERTDLKVISAKSQVTYKSAAGRSIRLDIRAETAGGEVVDIEIQRADQGAGARRARFYGSMIDRTLLNAGDAFEKLPDTWVIFITEHDIFKRGVPLYHVERKVAELDNALFSDGSHIVYVNGQFRDENHPVGRLMHDFFCTRAEDMLNPLLADEVKYLKETEGGQGQMSRVLEEMCREAAYNEKLVIARQFLAEGIQPEVVARCTGLSLDTVLDLAGAKSA